MKLFNLYLLLFVIIVSSCKQRIERHDNKTAVFPESKQSTGELKFIKDKLDFGTIPQDTVIKGDFKFINAGTGKLIIDNIEPDCSCTSAYLSKKVLSPKDTGRIILTVNTHKKQGEYELNSTVTANTHTHIYLLSLFFKVK